MIYEYFCDKCKDTQEVDFNVGEQPDSLECECGNKMRRIYKIQRNSPMTKI